jgi:hypothetical protein
MLRLLARTTVVALIVSAFPSTGLAQVEAIPADLVIKLERTACFGRCPVYSVTLDAKGNVVFEGTQFVAAHGRHTDSIPASSIAALLATARRIGFFDLSDSYRAPISDLPTTFVTITANGRTKRVEDYFGAPQGLKDLERQIDDAARTERWIRVAPQAQTPIEWSPNRKLTVEDFTGEVPKISRQGNVERGALSFLRIEASIACTNQRIVGSARAVFLPSQSWWAGAQSRMWERVRDSKSWLTASRQDLEMKAAIRDANGELLKHEQLHFDMAEIAARKIRRRFSDATDACSDDGDVEALNRFVGEVTRDYRQEQARYDQDTKHGTFLFGQGKWESRVRAALSE